MYFISQFGSKIDVRKAVMLWIHMLVYINYSESVDGQNINYQKNVA